MADNEELNKIKRLMLYYIFSTPREDIAEEIESKLRAKGLLERTRKCFYACREYAKALIDEELKEKGESK